MAFAPRFYLATCLLSYGFVRGAFFICLSLLCSLSRTLLAQAPAITQPPPTAAVIPPKPNVTDDVPYPFDGTGDADVLLTLLISDAGNVREIKAATGQEPFVSQARASVARWTYEPAQRGGVKVASVIRVLIHFDCTWKAAQEAFMEGYHVVETHADGMPMFGSVATQIDVWSEGSGYVSRLCTPGMTTDPYVAHKVTPHQGLILYCSSQDLPLPPADRGNDPVDARAYAAEAKRKVMQAATGIDYSGETISYMIDMAKYFMYPNHHPWWGEGLPWWYKFTPYKDDPGKSVMEYRLLLPIPANGERPPVPEPIIVDFGETAADNPALGATGHIIDQDLSNMNAVHLGLKSAPPEQAFLVTSAYQEAKIRRFHEIYDEKLGLSL